ncbi:MAG TPA: hypothetical protein VMB77_13440, partial [Syntrophales bacterium]|nr:hypothetical protein [Syntrophales bacterium]
ERIFRRKHHFIGFTYEVAMRDDSDDRALQVEIVHSHLIVSGLYEHEDIGLDKEGQIKITCKIAVPCSVFYGRHS